MLVEHILTEKGQVVITIEPERTLLEAARLLEEKRVRAVVVSDTAHPVLGILSERDIVRALARKGAAAANDPVSQHMTAKVITCTRRTSIKDLMERMTDQRIRHVPVVENGRLDGIVSIGDLVKHRLSELEAEDRAMHDYSTGRSTPGRRF